VAKNEDFKEFAKNIAMHIAASNPLGIAPEDVPNDIIEKEKEIYRAQALEMGKPENVVDKIVEGKLKKFYEDSCLLNQPYVRDNNISIADLLNDLIAKIGENISIKRFVRYQIGES
jgi:elongation factor Ts